MPASVTATMPSTLSALSSQTMIRGKAGQTSRVCLAGVLFEQKSRKLRRSGDPKTMRRQRRHKCTSVCHPSIRYAARTEKSNIFGRTSSGKLAGWLTSPGLHRIESVSSCRGMSCRLEGRISTVIHCQLISRQSCMIVCSRRAFRTANLSESMTQGVKEIKKEIM